MGEARGVKRTASEVTGGARRACSCREMARPPLLRFKRFLNNTYVFGRSDPSDARLSGLRLYCAVV